MRNLGRNTAARFFTRMLALVPIVNAAGCTDFASPAELSKPQILALRLEPAQLAPGERGQLSTLVAGPQGPIESAPQWSVESEAAALTSEDGATWLEAKDEAVAGDSIGLVASFAIEGQDLVARRSVRIAAESGGNPMIDAILVNGEPLAGATMSAVVGSIVELGVQSPIDFDQDGASVTWYATVGEIEIYHQPTAELETLQAGSGWLIVVCRDGRGGVSWLTTRLEIADET